MQVLTDLPQDLPIPIDDGKCNHLTNSYLPDTILNSTKDEKINLSKLQGLWVLYFLPNDWKT